MARDIFTILEAEHRDLMRLLDEVERAAPPQRQAAFDRLWQEFEAHTVAEREILYDRLHSDPLTRPTVLFGEQEHHVVESIFRELYRLRPDSERFAAKLHVMRELLRHHIDEEEHDLFPKARQILGEQEPARMGEQFSRRRRGLVT